MFQLAYRQLGGKVGGVGSSNIALWRLQLKETEVTHLPYADQQRSLSLCLPPH